MTGIEYILITGSVCGAITGIVAIIFKVHSYIVKVDKFEEELKEIETKMEKYKQKSKDRIVELRKYHDEDIARLTSNENVEFAEIQKEQRILMKSVLSCLKILKDGKANGEVEESIRELNDYLVDKSHT